MRRNIARPQRKPAIRGCGQGGGLASTSCTPNANHVHAAEGSPERRRSSRGGFCWRRIRVSNVFVFCISIETNVEMQSTDRSSSSPPSSSPEVLWQIFVDANGGRTLLPDRCGTSASLFPRLLVHADAKRSRSAGASGHYISRQ